MEPSTGKILAMVSKPDFDPNTLAANWSQITGEGSDSVLVNRATQGLYPPGSTFKLITMLEYLREHKMITGSITIYVTVLTNWETTQLTV